MLRIVRGIVLNLKLRAGNTYSAEMCRYIENSSMCPYGDNCNKAHNRVE